MDGLRRDLQEMFERRQARLGQLGETRRRLVSGAMARREEQLDRRAQWIAGVATALIAVLLVATFVYIRNGAAGRGGPVGQTASSARTATPPPVQPGEKSPAPGFSVVMYDGDATDASHGWALVTNCVQPMQGSCQYAVQATSDGGRSWTAPVHVGGDFDPVDGGAFRQLVFINPSDGFAYGGTVAYVTHDGGRSWSQLRLQSTFIGFIAGHDKFVVVTVWPCAKGAPCSYQVDSSVDGGRAWSPPSSLPSGFGPNGASAFSDRGALISSEISGDLELTLDGGATWTLVGSPCAQGTILNVAAATADGRELWEFCLDHPSPADASNSSRSLFRSDDGGASWKSLPIKPVPTAQAANGYFMVAASSRPGTLIVASNVTSMMITHDGGGSWRDVGPAGVGFLSIHFVDARFGVALDTSRGMWTTVDGGDHWTQWSVEITTPLAP